MYRPTVRMDDRFREWLDDISVCVTLDKNQLLRLALFLTGHSKRFKIILESYLKDGVKSFPSPNWDAVEHGLWLNQTYERGRGVTSQSIDVSSDFELIDGREGKLIVRTNEKGVIKWTL